RRSARIDPGGDDDLVEAFYSFLICRVIQEDSDVQAAKPLGVVRDRFGELLLAGNRFREVELAAELRSAFEQRHLVAALGCDCRAREAGRSAANHRDASSFPCVDENKLGLSSRPGIDDAARGLAGEVVVEASLVAGE